MKNKILFLCLFVTTAVFAQQPQLWVQGDAADTTFVEGFESNTLGSFTTGGGSDWFVSNFTSYEGILSARAGDVPNAPADTSWLETTIQVSGHAATLSFAMRAIPSNVGTIEFFINGNRELHLNDETPWKAYSFDLLPGHNVIRWHYRTPGALSAPPNGNPESLNLNTVYLDAISITSVINPTVRIEDGTEGQGKILTSDSLGNAAWISPGTALQPAQRDLPWVLCDSLPQTAPLILCNDATNFSSALHIKNAYYGVLIDTAYANGILIRDPQFNGIYVSNSGSHGFRTFSTGADGFYSNLSGDDGFHAFIPENYGFHAERTGSHGFYAENAGRDFGGNIVNGTASAFEATNSAGSDFESNNAGVDGFHSSNAGDDGFHSSNAGDDGFYSSNAGDDGFLSSNAGGKGVYVVSAGEEAGRFINSVGSTAHALYSEHGDGDGMDLYLGGTARIGTHASFNFYIDENDTGSNDNFVIINSDNENIAQFFESGNAYILGNINKGGGSFLIDHPLDPENKYLYHSFVESPDMMNIYNGNITTDAGGIAVVELPTYFESLNRDFHYQLTVIGAFAQAIVKEEISGNHFTIQTDQPHIKVSWQVTGVRQDAYANANRIVPEVEKEVHNKGRYLHADAWAKKKGVETLPAHVNPESETDEKHLEERAREMQQVKEEMEDQKRD